MTLTAKHIECAEVCARLEFSGEQDAKSWPKSVVFRAPRSGIGSKTRRFWPKKPGAKPNFGLTCLTWHSHIAAIA